MGLIQKKKLVGNFTPLYRVGQGYIKLVVGLGNIGTEYFGTRHNIGFEIVEEFTKNIHHAAVWGDSKDFKSQIVKLLHGDTRLVLLKPNTYMNESGQAVRLAKDYFKISLKDVIVVHDDIDIPFGEIRTKTGGGSAGHNGIKSISEAIGEDFQRVRVGVGRPENEKMDVSSFVLSKFNQQETDKIPEIITAAATRLNEIIFK